MNVPVIPQINTFDDAKSALQNIRAYYEGIRQSQTTVKAQLAQSTRDTSVLFDIKDYGGIPNDNSFNNIPFINAAMADASVSGGTVHFGRGFWNIDTGIVQPYNNVMLKGNGFNETKITSASEITMLALGTYEYTGINDYDGSLTRYYTDVSDLTIENTASVKTNVRGLVLRAIAYSQFHNLQISGCPYGIQVKPITSWNQFDDILIQGPGLQSAIRVEGTGYNANYNSTGNIYSNIRAVGFGTAAFECYGAVFGDIIVNGLAGYGNSATAGILLTSVGGKYYAHKLSFSGGIDLDGSMTYGISTNGVSNLSVDFNLGGLVITESNLINCGANISVRSSKGTTLSNFDGSLIMRTRLNNTGDGWIFEAP